MGKKFFLALVLVTGLSPFGQAQVFDIAGIIKAAVDKVIRAVDLEIQEEQLQTILLQDAEEREENQMISTELNAIGSWTGQQEELFSEYYAELRSVKQVIADFNTVKNIAVLESKILTGYDASIHFINSNNGFTSDEVRHMLKIYQGILNQSSAYVAQSVLVLTGGETQMDDAGRLAIIEAASLGLGKNYSDLKEFTNQQIELSVSRGNETGEISTLKRFYGIP